MDGYWSWSVLFPVVVVMIVFLVRLRELNAHLVDIKEAILASRKQQDYLLQIPTELKESLNRLALAASGIESQLKIGASKTQLDQRVEAEKLYCLYLWS